ncbi:MULTISPECIES: DUF6530 family protein [Pseudomonas]|uniref:DUF6530 family protein n=1 Tax=Pseudomonas TaxID=286 RepID=UPI000A0FDD40|nr:MULTISPECIES: DUF6530 family protein [Pseudomonas]MDP9539274.1 DUF6530 family protein [Pseudomonas putida]MDV5386617.1 DUF6530 family protein [Pseudomonas juntendi]ORL52804.1 hypothetical protein B7H18_04845 [Pseudomonas putida]
MKIPTHLKHIPLITVENYDQIDGPHQGDTDAKGLSIGIAQWNGPGESEISAKVWRYTGEKWSRQSEELPIHRVLDLATLVCNAIQYCENGHQLPTTVDFNVSLADGETDSTRLHNLMKEQFVKNEKYLDASLDRLAEALKRLGKI